MDIEFYEKDQKLRVTTKKYMSTLDLPTPTNCIKGIIKTNEEEIIYVITANIQDAFDQDFVYIFRADLSNGKMIFIDEVMFLDRTTDAHESKLICCTKDKIFLDNKIIRFKKKILTNAMISGNKKNDFWEITAEFKGGYLIKIILFRENFIFEKYDKNIQYSFQNLFFTDFTLVKKHKNKHIVKIWIETENIKELTCINTKEEFEFTNVFIAGINQIKNKPYKLNTIFLGCSLQKENLIKAYVLKTDDEKTVKIIEEEFNAKTITKNIETQINTFIINNWKKPKNKYEKNLMIFNLTGEVK